MKLLNEIGYLFVRGLKQSTRPTAALIPSLFMPAFFFIISSAAFSSVANLPGFNSSSYLQFYAPAAILIHRTTGRAATAIEMVFVSASAAWPVLLVILIERQRRKFVKGP